MTGSVRVIPIVLVSESRESHLAARDELTFPCEWASRPRVLDGGNDTFCDGCVNWEASDNALPVASCRKSWKRQRFRRHSFAAHPRSRGNLARVAQKVCAVVTHRNRLRVRELGAVRGVREGREKKKRGWAKKKMPPPVPCGSSFGNPLIERGASRVSFGSHYSPGAERRGWACERHPH